jgi:hypothetical protein
MSLCAMLAMASSTFATDTFSVDAVSLSNISSAPLVVRFSLDAGSDCSGYQFWIQLPEELEFVVDDLDIPVYAVGDSYKGNPSITPNIDGGYMKVAAYTAGSVPLTKQEGILVSFMVKVKSGATVTVGQTLTGHLTEGAISNEGGQTHSVADSDFTITITDKVVLDENYLMVPEATSGNVNVLVKRTIYANQWSTICLPFAMTVEKLQAAFGDEYQLYYISGYEKETDTNGKVTSITINFTKREAALQVNRPYIIKIDKDEDITEFVVNAVKINPTDGYHTAVLESDDDTGEDVEICSMTGNLKAGKTVPAKSLFLSEDKFWYSTGLTKMKAFRAYFTLNDVLDAYNQNSDAPVFINIGGETTRLDQLNIDYDDDNYYTLDGRAVKTPGKGVYIHRGKKIIIK